MFHRRCIAIYYCIFTGLLLGLTNGYASAQDTNLAAELNKLLEAEWEYTLRESPTFASQSGDKRYNDRWPDVSLAAIQRRHEHQQEVLARLDKMDREKLPPADRLNYLLFRKEIENDLEQYPFKWYLAPLDQRNGIQTENELGDAIPFTRVKDYEDWIARLRAVPKYIEQTTELMRAGIKERIVQPKAVMRRLPEQLRKHIVDDPASSLYYKPLKTFPANISHGEQQRLKTEAAAAIREHVVPAYRQFAKFFNDEYFPACFDSVGAWQLPRGQEFYAMRARQYTTTKLTPDEIHAIGFQEVARIRKEMERIVEQVGYQGTFQEFLMKLRTDKRFYYDSPEDL
jgi:prolyl oligopeptidase